MLLEEGFECHTRGLSRLFWLPVQEPRALADERREFSSFSRISPHIERQVEWRQHNLPKAGTVRMRLTRAGSLQLNWPGSSGPKGAGGGTR